MSICYHEEVKLKNRTGGEKEEEEGIKNCIKCEREMKFNQKKNSA
jgi:hypothetical protein